MARRESSSALSLRQLRVGASVRQSLAQFFLRLSDVLPELSGSVVTVSEVRMSPDLGYATAFISSMGEPGIEVVLAAINGLRSELRKEIARTIQLKFVPELRFVADKGVEHFNKVMSLLSDPAVARDLADDVAEEDQA